MLAFPQVLKSTKWQNILSDGGKNGRNAFCTCAKIHFCEKYILESGAL